ncbi:hypothetical protein NSND_50485 [Nitrospira sp. ND1]|nr:hypothetical protein NSND_50485 [Nitrospira sp. ND1]
MPVPLVTYTRLRVPVVEPNPYPAVPGNDAKSILRKMDRGLFVLKYSSRALRCILQRASHFGSGGTDASRPCPARTPYPRDW